MQKRIPKALRYVKLNDVCHDPLVDRVNLCGRGRNQVPNPDRSTTASTVTTHGIARPACANVACNAHDPSHGVSRPRATSTAGYVRAIEGPKRMLRGRLVNR